MTIFWFYLCVILVIFTVAAALADGLGRAFPDFLEPDADDSEERKVWP